jgi:hypothetical protein
MAQRLTTDRRRAPASLPSDPMVARDEARSGRRRQRRAARRRWQLVAVAVLLAGAAVGGVVIGQRAWQRLAPGGSSGATVDAGAGAKTGGPGVAMATVGPAELGPVRGTGTFAYVTTSGPVHGAAGALKRFRVAVENGSGQDVAAFATAVERPFADPRGWTAGRQLRLQRVAGQGAADFTIFLATPATSETMCAAGGLHTDQYTSCRLPGKIIINLARWLSAVPDYGAPLADYQAYAINHEVGHELGRGHEACPGRGRPAPVMQQQTLGLKGCAANAWPYLDGQPYTGPKVP